MCDTIITIYSVLLNDIHFFVNKLAIIIKSVSAKTVAL